MNDPWAWSQLRDLASEPVRRHDLLSDVIGDAAQFLVRTKDNVTAGDPERRVVDWFLKLLEEFKAMAAAARQQLDANADEPDATKMLGALHDLVGEMVRRVHFGARADLRQQGGKKVEPPRTIVREYIDLVRPIMRGILAFAEPTGAGALSANAAHNFMELLNVALPFGPEEALAMAAKTAASASATGYQFDSLAVKEVIRLVETVLADYRDRLTSGDPLSDTLGLLDVFADAGWPEALRLVWRLDEVFR